MQGSTKIPITDLNEHITCRICNGYFIDATTIIECLHTFCRSCIVKYFEKNKYCPVCDVLVHKTKPLLNIRSDKTIQDIVYKLVPRLFQNEMHQRRTFYENRPDVKPTSLEQASYHYLLTAEESICLTLCYHGSNNKPRYLRCPAAVSVGHLKKLIQAKYDLTVNHKIDILYNQDCLNYNLTLMDVAYIYLWKRKEPMQLTYRIYEYTAKKQKLDYESVDAAQANNNNNNWKEVQLRISENGEMSITGIQDNRLSPSLLEIVNNDTKYKDDAEEVNLKSVNKNEIKKELPGLKLIGKGNSKIDSPPQSVANIPTPTNDKTKNECPAENSSAYPPTTSSATENSSYFTNATRNPSSSSCSALSGATTTTVYSTINSSMCSTKSEEPPAEERRGSDSKELPLKRKMESAPESEPPAKQPKQTILNHSIGLMNLSNNHPLKKHSKLNRNGENLKDALAKLTSSVVTKTSNSVNTIVTSEITISRLTSNNNNNNDDDGALETPLSKSMIMSTKSSIIPAKTNAITYSAAKPPCYMPKTNYHPIITVPKPTTSISQISREVESRLSPTTCTGTSKSDNKQNNITCSQHQPVQNSSKPSIKTKPSTPIGYKTLRDPPKSWNSQISKANLCKSSPEQKPPDSKNVKPAKFFKMRNNIPRYLGNPASGVKPMYQVHSGPDKDMSHDVVNRTERSEIKKHSIVKIDPKTLKPISEKAPEMTSLSNNVTTSQSQMNHNLNYPNPIHSNPVSSSPKINIHSDLRINTSSVSIFSPLKLQSSPKNDRKSPKSPHSPKIKATTSPTGCKREKVNLNFTPANPFIPNLASPTMSPNQFLYTTGPPGFPPYDPRVMAAYHNLWYGQRMPFPGASMPALNMNLDMLSSPSSPKMGALSQGMHNHQIPSRPPSTTSPNISPLSRKHTSVPSPTMTKPANSNKKNSRESKNEKSLQNAVDKLTQNRQKPPTVKESSASTAVTMRNQENHTMTAKAIEETPKEIGVVGDKKEAPTSLSANPEAPIVKTETSEPNNSIADPDRKLAEHGPGGGEASKASRDNTLEKPPDVDETVSATESAPSDGAQSKIKLEDKLTSQCDSFEAGRVGAEETKSAVRIEEIKEEPSSGSSNLRNRKNGDNDNGKGNGEVSKEDYPKYLGFQFF